MPLCDIPKKWVEVHPNVRAQRSRVQLPQESVERHSAGFVGAARRFAPPGQAAANESHADGPPPFAASSRSKEDGKTPTQRDVHWLTSESHQRPCAQLALKRGYAGNLKVTSPGIIP
jgi:hypothetical protein